MREQRIKVSDSQLDELEIEWWNTNAATIEKIWALNYELQKIIRLPYLKKMKSFFLKGVDKLPIKVLEIGCGSGWVCRMVADNSLHVIGTDFSSEQLAIAREQAIVHGKEKFCTYIQADASAIPDEIDAVVIHALLHHLAINELSTFFHQLSKLPAKTKVFIYEPVFLQKKSTVMSLRDKVLNRVIIIIKKYAFNRIVEKGYIDYELDDKLKKIYEDAKRNGWYISPKEVPFYENELEGYLTSDFFIQNKSVVNKTDLEVAQALIMYNIDKPCFLFSRLLIPTLSWLDKLSFKWNFTSYLRPFTHHFVCYELVRK
jgi:ubiquinone/menaquinone biosynthesis C-methylase UbiE